MAIDWIRRGEQPVPMGQEVLFWFPDKVLPQGGFIVADYAPDVSSLGNWTHWAPTNPPAAEDAPGGPPP